MKRTLEPDAFRVEGSIALSVADEDETRIVGVVTKHARVVSHTPLTRQMKVVRATTRLFSTRNAFDVRVSDLGGWDKPYAGNTVLRRLYFFAHQSDDGRRTRDPSRTRRDLARKQSRTAQMNSLDEVWGTSSPSETPASSSEGRRGKVVQDAEDNDPEDERRGIDPAAVSARAASSEDESVKALLSEMKQMREDHARYFKIVLAIACLLGACAALLLVPCRPRRA